MKKINEKKRDVKEEKSPLGKTSEKAGQSSLEKTSEKKEKGEIEVNNEDNDKINEGNEGIEENPKLSKKQNKQVSYAIILMIVLVMIILTVPFFVKNFMNKFKYESLEFQKTKTGDLFLYSMKIPLLNQNQQITDYYKMDLREDPRKLDYINVEIPDNAVIFIRNNVTYISVDSDAPICENNVFSVLTLSYFLKEFGGLEIKGAVDNPDVAKEKKLAYATCGNSPNNTVISIMHSNETVIRQKSRNCYEITYKDCEINPAIERFILIILEKYMNYIKN